MEQKEMSKAYAVDFDGTLCENRWPEIGEPNQELIGYLVGRRRQGDKVILWTCRSDCYIRDGRGTQGEKIFRKRCLRLR